jgi:hypothetical protein
MTQIEINIDDYLSEEEKKDLCIKTFKEAVNRELLNGANNNTIQSDTEIQRVIGNISHHIIMNEVQKHIPDFEQMIKDKVRKNLTTQTLNYEVFKVKNVWDSKESLAVTYINETVKECRDMFKERIKKEIENYDLSEKISNEVSSIFDELAGNLYKLSELFLSKKLT